MADEADDCGLDPVERVSQNYFESFTEGNTHQLIVDGNTP